MCVCMQLYRVTKLHALDWLPTILSYRFMCSFDSKYSSCRIHVVVYTVDCVRALTVLWKILAGKQVEKLHYVDAEVEVVIMTKREGVLVLTVAKAMLEVVLSVAASVISSLLLLSGDVEENPGPIGGIKL